jgi:hypothetical protein
MQGHTRQCLYPQDAQINLCELGHHGSFPSPACAALLHHNCSAAKAANQTQCHQCIQAVQREHRAAAAANCTQSQLWDFCEAAHGETELRACAPIDGISPFFSVSTCSRMPRFEDCAWSAAPCQYSPYDPPGQ